MTDRRITVTGDIDIFKQNEVLTSSSAIATYYRTIVNEGADAPTKLTDTQILEIVDSIKGDDEDSEVERVQLMELGPLTPTASEAAE